MTACVICLCPDEDKSMVYRLTPWCCGQHQKLATMPAPACGNKTHDHNDDQRPEFGMFCPDCYRPVHYDNVVEDYFHDNPAAACFLHGVATHVNPCVEVTECEHHWVAEDFVPYCGLCGTEKPEPQSHSKAVSEAGPPNLS